MSITMNLREEADKVAAELGIELPPGLDLEKALAEYRDVWKGLNQEEKDALKLAERGLAAGKSFTVRGFQDFYWCIWKREAPPYAKRWVEQFMSGKWTILNCFRGSTKSTTLTITFTAFALGHQPYTSALIVQANDTSANKSTATIADIIEHYEGWKACFPNIVPDKEKGWGANGYFIKDEQYITENDYGKWLQVCQKDHLRDPSFVGNGIGSSEIVGMHPRRLLFDDIHDLKNSAYPRDRENVVAAVRANVIPTITKANDKGEERPFIGVACTFWDKNDAYNELLGTGLFEYIATPIMEYAENGTHEFDGRKVNLTWESGFDIAMIKTLRDTNSSAEFDRMYLCTLTGSGMKHYKSWLPYEADKINWEWPLYCGSDPVNAYMAVSGREGSRSHYALCYGLRTPTGTVVIGDGVLEQCTPSEAEEYIVRAQMSYPGYQTTVVEAFGGGGIFISFLQRHPNLRVVPSDTFKNQPKGKKEVRQYELLEPLFRNGVLQVSDAHSPFLNAVRHYMDRYPNMDAHDPGWDVADSIYLMVLGIPDIQTKAEVAGGRDLYKKTKRPNPWAQLGAQL